MGSNMPLSTDKIEDYTSKYKTYGDGLGVEWDGCSIVVWEGLGMAVRLFSNVSTGGVELLPSNSKNVLFSTVIVKTGLETTNAG